MIVSDINDCASLPCDNGATCMDLIDSYQCNCIPGYTDSNCRTGYLRFLLKLAILKKLFLNFPNYGIYRKEICFFGIWIKYFSLLSFLKIHYICQFRHQRMWQQSMSQWSFLFESAQLISLYLRRWLYWSELSIK